MGDLIEEGGPGMNYTPSVPKPFTRAVWQDNKGWWQLWPFRPIKVTITKNIDIVDTKPYVDGIDIVELAKATNRHGMNLDLTTYFTRDIGGMAKLEVTAKFVSKQDAVMFRMSLP